MRLYIYIFILLLLCIFPLGAQQERSESYIRISAPVSLAGALDEIESQTNYSFIYDAQVINLSEKVRKSLSGRTVFEILKQRDGILQVYQTFALILPSLLVFALQGCDVEIMPHYKQAMKALRLGHAPGVWRSFSKLGYDILRIGGNSLFSELYSTFGLYNKLAFFTEAQMS